jgi:hypothetical protein
MRTRQTQPDEECSRAREWSSLRLDAPLSEIESVLLEAHLGRCPNCRAFAQTVTCLTEMMRAAPPERARYTFQAPRPRHAHFRGWRAASVAAAAAALATGSVLGLQVSRGGVPTAAHRLDAAVIGLKENQLQELDSAGQAAPRPVRAGLAAAEQITVGPAVDSTEQQSRTTRRLSPDG